MHRKIIIKITCCICLTLSVLFCSAHGRAADLKVIIVDVGMGQAVLLVQDDHAVLIDTGPADYAEHVLSRITNYGVQTLDYLVLSHLHPDHAGGYFKIREKWPATPVLDSCQMPGTLYPDEAEFFSTVSSALLHDSKRDCLAAGDVINWMEHEVQVLWPVVSSGSNINHDSLVLLLKNPDGGHVLIMGDVDKTVEGRLKRDLQSSLLFHGVTLYVAAHHAAIDSTDSGFLSVLHPQVSVVSVGRNNQFGYPSGESMRVLEKYSKTVMRTDMDGEVCFVLQGTAAISCKQ